MAALYEMVGSLAISPAKFLEVQFEDLIKSA
jgi:hypothetical protein